MYTPEDLRVFLYTARRYERQVISRAPISGVVVKLTDATDLEFEQAIDNYWALLKQNSSVDTIMLVAAVNDQLLDRQYDREVQDAVAERFLRPEYASFLREPFHSDVHTTFRVAITRLGCLLTLKLLISLLPPSGVERSGGGTTPEPHVAGDLGVLANEFTGSSSIREGNAPSLLELVLEFVPRWDIDNPPDLAYSWSRAFAMLQHLRGNDAMVRTLRQAATVDAEELRFCGLTLDEFIAAAFVVFAHMNRTVPDGGTNVLLHAKSVADEFRFSFDIVHRFLAAIAISLGALQAKVQPVPLSREAFELLVRSDLYATDTVVLRKHPIVALTDDEYLVLDRHFVTEAVSSGVYWHLFDTLEGVQRERLRELWGRLFELYVHDLLGHYYPPVSQMLRVNVSYTDGEIDALLDFGEVVILVEAKASLLFRKARFSRDPSVFERDIQKKFVETPEGKPKALKQLANAAAAIASRRVATAVRPRRIFPVLLGDEPSLQSLGVNAYLNELFERLVPTDARAVVAPLTVMTIEELEELLPYVSSNVLAWATLLEERFNGRSVGMESIHQAIYVHRNATAAPYLRNDFLLSIFHRMWEEMIAVHRTGEGLTVE